MARHRFIHVRTWVFDLDNTLYPPGARLFDQIEARMNGFIRARLGLDEAAAAALRRDYWRDHGTTLTGLMTHHRVEPDGFLEEVHSIDLTGLTAEPGLRAAIAALPGRKIVYTNGSRGHARGVTAALGLAGLFDALYGVEDAGYAPKPRAEAFAAVFDADGLDPCRAAMFEDDPRNLAVPHALGMRTVLVGPGIPPAPHIHHCTEDLPGFLSQLV
ncbi:pyrimidine 5'-nucleotidase [Rhodobacteraceae bacterium 2CG4]|uniref:Pyrimidine 5'-nucleotidase n=1 Tax=Halovulum marinum TaxID=2662447 RepID=A0A6L5Z007_9RHOB|nr:pyrimidine 5'-nucleotidase [Halovulum marinum]MSU89818.1 pyrimidine 5'-nucleotidase [Halovulum marinum]